jgi:hypothetical protein
MMEGWNTGKMGLGYCNVGLMVHRRNEKKKNGKYPLKKPIFHHSTIPLFHD